MILYSMDSNKVGDIIKNCPKRPSYPEAYGLRHLAFAVDSVDNAVKEVTDSATEAVSSWFLPF